MIVSPKKRQKKNNEKKSISKEKNMIKLISFNNDNKKIDINREENKFGNYLKINNKEFIKHVSLTNKKIIINGSNSPNFKRSFSLSLLDDKSAKSNGQKLSPLLIDTFKYMKFNIQINYYKNKEVEKIEKIFNKIVSNKNVIKTNNLTITYDDLYVGYLNYIGQKRFLFESYSENKKIFHDLSKYINEDKKNGNIINTLYDKDDFIRILIIFKEKYLEYRLKNSYQRLKKSNVTEIFNFLNEIEQKSEFNYYKKYFTEIKNIMLNNRLKEIYLFYEFKNLIVTSVKNIYIKEMKEKKEKEKQKKEKEKQNKIKMNNSIENTKNNGIKGIIRVVTKNSQNKNKVYHVENYDKNKNNTHSTFKNDSS